ncbi:MAG: VOC family protein [Phycisphaerae bacterium]|nr:VOC family protein [Phycisphaerae bacterium]
MLAIGDIHVYVSEFAAALDFWAGGLQLEVAEKEESEHGSFARLDFPDGGPSLVLIAPVEPWDLEQGPEPGTAPGFSFDVTTTDFDGTLARLLERNGRQVGETETYNDLRLATVADPEGNTFELVEVPE